MSEKNILNKIRETGMEVLAKIDSTLGMDGVNDGVLLNYGRRLIKTEHLEKLRDNEKFRKTHESLEHHKQLSGAKTIALYILGRGGSDLGAKPSQHIGNSLGSSTDQALSASLLQLPDAIAELLENATTNDYRAGQRLRDILSGMGSYRRMHGAASEARVMAQEQFKTSSLRSADATLAK